MSGSLKIYIPAVGHNTRDSSLFTTAPSQLPLDGTTPTDFTNQLPCFCQPTISNPPVVDLLPFSNRQWQTLVRSKTDRPLSRSLDLDRPLDTMTSLNWRSETEATDDEDILAERSSQRARSPGLLRRQSSSHWTPILSPRHTPVRFLPLSDTPPPFGSPEDGERRRRHSSRHLYRSVSQRSNLRSTERLNGHGPRDGGPHDDVIRKDGDGVRDYDVTYLSPGDGEGRLSRGLGQDDAEIGLPSKTDGTMSPSPPSTKYTRTQILALINIALMNLLSSTAFSVIAPFFPTEANKKGTSDTLVGLIFGLFELVIFIMSPIYGSKIAQIGPNFMFKAGVFLCGACAVIFGFLDKLPDGNIFIGFCFLCRTVEANGAAMFLTASFAILAQQFPGKVSTVMGILELFSGVGMMIGPVLGGALYQLGGYSLPFISIGVTMLCGFLFSVVFLPEETDEELPSGGFLTLMKIPGVFVTALVIFGCAIALSFLDPTFSKHLQSFGLSPTLVGVIFLIGPGVYAIVAPFFGYLADKGFLLSQMWIGSLILGVSYLLIGPSPLLGESLHQLWVVIIGCVLLGIGVGASILPTFQMTIILAGAYGFPEGISTYGKVSGMFNSAFALGAFIGPTASGSLVSMLNFEWSVTVCGGIMVFMAFVVLFYILFHNYMGCCPDPDLDFEEEDSDTQGEEEGGKETDRLLSGSDTERREQSMYSSVEGISAPPLVN